MNSVIIQRFFQKYTPCIIANAYHISIHMKHKQSPGKDRITSIRFLNPPTIDLTKTFQGCNILFIPVGLENYGGRGHANFFIVYPKRKMLEHFEPNGGPHGPAGPFSPMDYERIKQFIKKSFHIEIQRVRSAHETCPTLGLQGHEIMSGKANALDMQGYCLFWSLLFVEAKLRFPNTDSLTLQKRLIQAITDAQYDFKEYIHNYATYLYFLEYKALFVFYTFFPETHAIWPNEVYEDYIDIIHCIVKSDCHRSDRLQKLIHRYRSPEQEFQTHVQRIGVVNDLQVQVNPYKTLTYTNQQKFPHVTVTSKNLNYTYQGYGTGQHILKLAMKGILDRHDPILGKKKEKKLTHPNPIYAAFKNL